jgi:xanthosine utilization system XapX-like protein
MEPRILRLIAMALAAVCFICCIVYDFKARNAKSHARHHKARTCMEKAYWSYCACFIIVGAVLFTLLPHLNKPQTIAAVILLGALAFILPQKKQMFMQDLRDKKTTDSPEKHTSLVGKSYFYIFAKYQLAWGAGLLVLAIYAYLDHIFQPDPPKENDLTILSFFKFFLFLFLAAIPVNLVLALWRYLKSRKQRNRHTHPLETSPQSHDTLSD